MPKREEAITIAATPDIEGYIAIVCRSLNLDPTAHGAAQKAIRHALVITAATRLAQPAASDLNAKTKGEDNDKQCS